MIIDIIAQYEYDSEIKAYLVQAYINTSIIEVIRQATPEDVPSSIVLPAGYTGSTQFNVDDFSVISISGVEYVVLIAYELLMLRIKKND